MPSEFIKYKNEFKEYKVNPFDLIKNLINKLQFQALRFNLKFQEIFQFENGSIDSTSIVFQ